MFLNIIEKRTQSLEKKFIHAKIVNNDCQKQSTKSLLLKKRKKIIEIKILPGYSHVALQDLTRRQKEFHKVSRKTKQGVFYNVFPQVRVIQLNAIIYNSHSHAGPRATHGPRFFDLH